MKPYKKLNDYKKYLIEYKGFSDSVSVKAYFFAPYHQWCLKAVCE